MTSAGRSGAPSAPAGPRSLLARRTVLIGLGALVAGACGSDGDGAGDDTTAAATPAAPPTSAGTTSAPEPTAPGIPTETVVARAEVDELRVFASVDAAEPERVLSRRDELSGELVLVVDTLADDEGRHQVQLPVRPNGSTGWVEDDDVSLTQHSFALEVLLRTHELVLYDAGVERRRVRAGVGTESTPTPGGSYYVKELLRPPNPDGPYGPYAYGLSGFSNVLTEFAGGDGVIGIHGTNEPAAVGTDVSHGCIRIENAVITSLVEDVGLPLGTPVVITA